MACRANSLTVSAFMISLLSPVLKRMVCGNFKESIDKVLRLDDVDKGSFPTLLRLGCGEPISEAKNLETLLQLAELSERFQMNGITVVLEEMLLQELKAETCIEKLARGEASGLCRLPEACYALLKENFQRISQTEIFLELSEGTMEKLLEEDELAREEDVLEALVGWMTRNGKDKDPRGEALLRKVRFGVIGDAYLAEIMKTALPGHTGLEQLISEAMVRKGRQETMWNWDGVQRLCDMWLVPRIMKGRIFGDGVLKQPQYIATDDQHRILVTDSELHQVVVFHYDGSTQQRIGSRGPGPGEFYEPTGIAVDPQGGSIFVADSGNGRIQVFDATGAWVRAFGTDGTAAGQLRLPQGVAIDAHGRVVVADHGNHRVQVFNQDGSVAFQLGARGTAVGQLWYPAGVAAAAAGRVAVADSENHRVQVFAGDGVCVALCLGAEGTWPSGQFQCALGVARDSQGRWVVSDSGGHRIRVFDGNGGLVRVVGGRKGSAVGEFDCPVGVAVDTAGRIWVVDRGNGRVQVL